MTDRFKESAEDLNTPADVQDSLTPVERAAADEFYNFCRHTGYTGPSNNPDSLCAECDTEARAVVAAVRPIIAAETIRKFADAYRFPPEGSDQ